MWIRRLSTHLATLSPPRSLPYSFISKLSPHSHSSSPTPSFRQNFSLFSRRFTASSAAEAENVGSCKEKLEALLDGREVRDVDYPEGHFGTKESPALIKSYYDKRIIGCPGPDGEDEHDIVWLWLEKGNPQECPVCSQYFELEVVGPGGSPDGHSEDDQH